VAQREAARCQITAGRIVPNDAGAGTARAPSPAGQQCWRTQQPRDVLRGDFEIDGNGGNGLGRCCFGVSAFRDRGLCQWRIGLG
jgi:hypothetical protein